MRILCLHGIGSNNDIFRMQTAGFRNHLEDYEFDFVQGQMSNVEGHKTVLSKMFGAAKLYGYYNLLDPHDVLKTERELLELVREDGPYDGIVGYSQGASLACQVIIRYAQEHPGCGMEEMPFRFAVLFNAATPNRVWELNEEIFPTKVNREDPEVSNFLRMMKKNPLMSTTKFKPFELRSGRQILTDKKLAMTKFDATLDGPQIKIPTLHIRCEADRPEYGAQTFALCEQSTAQQMFHEHMHDFPRGNEEMKKIATAIRSLAERA